MITSFEDLGLTGEEDATQVQAILEEGLEIKFEDILERLNSCLRERASEVAENFLVMVPFEDYDKLLEEQPQMVQFLREQAAQSKHWQPKYIGNSRDKKLPNMVELLFNNTAVNDGEAVMGYVFLSFSGKVLHLFVRGDS